MPRLNRLPALEVIRGLKGVLDFYYWKGIPCVRKWPRTPPSHRTAKSLAAAALFGAVVHAYALVGGAVKALFDQDAADQPRTGRDLYVSAVFGHLHDPIMSDFLTLLTEATASLATLTSLVNALLSEDTDQLLVLPAYDGANWQPLLVDAQRHLQADILSSALPTDAATDAHQVTQNTALALIEKLEKALQSVATDRLKVRGEDQLFSFNDTLLSTKSETISGANGWIRSHTPPANHIWAITNICTKDITSPTTKTLMALLRDVTAVIFHEHFFDVPANVRVCVHSHQFLTPGDVVETYLVGSLAGDTCLIELTGYDMTRET